MLRLTVATGIIALSTLGVVQAAELRVVQVNTQPAILVDGQVALGQGANLIQLANADEVQFLRVDVASDGLYTVSSTATGWRLTDNTSTAIPVQQYSWAEWNSAHYLPASQ